MPLKREAHDLIDTINSLIIACAQRQQKMLIKKPAAGEVILFVILQSDLMKSAWFFPLRAGGR